MDNSTLYPDLPTAPPMCTEELNCSPNHSNIEIIIQQSPAICGQANIQTCSNCSNENQNDAEDSQTKDIRTHPAIKLAWRTYMALVIFLLGICFFALPFFIYSLVKSNDGTNGFN